MRERVNRYTVIFCNKMTAQISYGNTTLEENVYLQGLRISGPSRKEAGLSNCGRRWPGAAGQGQGDGNNRKRIGKIIRN